MIYAGTEAELQVRETTSNKRAVDCSQRPIDRHHRRLVESSRITQELDKALVCLEAWYTATLQEPQS